MKDSLRVIISTLGIISIIVMMIGCSLRSEDEVYTQNEVSKQNKVVELIWYQLGAPQEDGDLVLKTVNDYIKDKIGVIIKIKYIGWVDYNHKTQLVINAGEPFDLMFTSSWANDFSQNAQKGAFLSLDDLLPVYGKEMLQNIDLRFWEAAEVHGKIYAVPSEKEIVNMPMWTFTKEYVDKYQIPYEKLHTLEDLEPWLKLIKENEPDVIPLYLTKDFCPPIYMDEIIYPLGIEYSYDTNNLIVSNLFETETMKSTLRTLREYYLKKYINWNAATISDDKTVKRFVTKGDGQPYADRIWSRNLGYEVVTSTIMETKISNYSARGAMTAISRTSKHPEKAIQFLNLLNTDEYLRNLINYGIEGVHYDKVNASDDELRSVEGSDHVYPFKIRYNNDNMKRYDVPYWVQGGLFNTYVPEGEPLDKWQKFRELNKNAETAPTFGFDFDSDAVSSQIEKIKSVMNEFVPPLYTGSVEPDDILPKLQQKLKENGIDKIQEEIQIQLDEWKMNGQ
ncbi:ABC transporter substrate-binding protein [Lachnoclostridium phytofermentans]|uniref:Extracellular solute-binding protein family 1 n=1 Tax=Lachnoclostridium phytofermentans (strain ATCC 700394 / DSM 18823 / ISDg) TaxID=357809 RepID=A9KS63_LACP7|nr:ABC transporter substrate-binding protein [Lachnoclostridium phytofermentans]ABX42095.1 extracellular solute-binding protein family 1 [Lachnoclostridium phytofermentans ISDg]